MFLTNSYLSYKDYSYYLNTVSLVVSISSGLGATVLILIIAIVIVVIIYMYCVRHFAVKKRLYR